MRGPTFSIEHSDYPAVESTEEVKVCVAYYGTQPLAANTTVQLSTDDNPVFQGQSSGISTHPVSLSPYIHTYMYECSFLWFIMSLPFMYVQLCQN